MTIETDIRNVILKQNSIAEVESLDLKGGAAKKRQSFLVWSVFVQFYAKRSLLIFFFFFLFLMGSETSWRVLIKIRNKIFLSYLMKAAKACYLSFKMKWNVDP